MSIGNNGVNGMAQKATIFQRWQKLEWNDPHFGQSKQ
jgi:hypothetical protein